MFGKKTDFPTPEAMMTSHCSYTRFLVQKRNACINVKSSKKRLLAIRESIPVHHLLVLVHITFDWSRNWGKYLSLLCLCCFWTCKIGNRLNYCRLPERDDERNSDVENMDQWSQRWSEIPSASQSSLKKNKSKRRRCSYEQNTDRRLNWSCPNSLSVSLGEMSQFSIFCFFFYNYIRSAF